MADKSTLCESGAKTPCLVMFGDLSCPVCRFALKNLLSHDRRGEQHLVYRHMLPHKGHTEMAAAILDEVAKEQRVELAYLRKVASLDFSSERALLDAAADVGVRDGAKRVGNPVDPARVRVLRDMALGNRLGIGWTPAFIEVPVLGKPRLLRPKEAYSLK